MCMGKPKVVQAPPAPVVAPPPVRNRDDVQAAGVDARKRVQQQKGVYGSIFTSVLGDPNYNTNVKAPAAVAALG